MIAAPAVPGHLAVENHVVDGKIGNGAGELRQILRKPVARVQPDVGAALVGEQPDAVELALEQPVAPLKRSCVSVAAIGSSQSGNSRRMSSNHIAG